MKYKEVIVVEIGQALVKLAIVCFSGKRIKDFSLDVFDASNQEALLRIEKLLSKYSGLNRRRKIIICFPRNLFVTRFLEFPSENEAEIREMLPFQLPKNFPYSLEDILYDFLVVAKSGGVSKVLVFILQTKKVNQALGFLKENKNILVDITVSSVGLYAWIKLQRSFLRRKLGANIILMDIDKNLAELVVISLHSLQFSRSFDFNSFLEFVQETQRTITAFKREFPDFKIDSVVLTGGLSLKSMPEDKLKGLFEPHPIFVLESLENIPCSHKIKDLCSNSEFSYSHLVGLSMDHDELPVAFLPDFLKEKKKRLSGKRKIKDVIAILLGLTLIFCALSSYSYSRKNLYLNLLNDSLQEFKLKTQKLDQVLERIKVIEKESKDKNYFSDILSNLPTLIPEDVFLSSLEFDDNENFSMRGYANIPSDVVDFTASLNKASFFQNTEISYINRRKQKTNILIEFRIAGSLRKP